MKRRTIIKKSALLLACIPLLLAGCSDEDDIIIYNPIDGYGVAVELLGCTQTGVTAKFIPEESVVKTEYAVGRKSDRDNFAAGTLTGIKSVEGNEAFRIEFTGLDPENAYTLFAKGYDRQGKSVVSSLAFHTAKTNFNVTNEYISDVSAGFRVTCDATYERLIYAFGTAADKEEFIAGTLKGIVTLKEPNKVYVAHAFDLEPETGYVFYCIGYDRFDNPVMLEENFTTTSSAGHPDIDFNAEIDIFRGIYTFTPNEHCGKIVATAFAEWDGKMTSMFHQHTWYGDLFTVLDDWAAGGWMAVSQTGGALNMVLDTYEVTLNMKVHVYVVIYDNDMKPYCAKYYACKTPTYDPDPGQATVNVDLINADEYGATFEFTLGENTMGVMFDLFTPDAFEEYMNSPDPYAIHNFFFNNWYIYSWIYAHDGWDINGVWEQTCWGWFQDGEEYYIVAAPMGYNGPGLGWGELFYKKITIDLTSGGAFSASPSSVLPVRKKTTGDKFKLYKL